MLNLMKKKTTTEKTAIQITPNQKATTTVANVAGKVKTGAFGVAPAPEPAAPADKQPAEKTPTDKQPADPTPVTTQTNKGNSAQDAKSQTGEQKPKGNNQTGKGNGQNGNNNKNANAAK